MDDPAIDKIGYVVYNITKALLGDKEAMGVSAYSYVLDLRLGKACELLLSSGMSIAEVAFETGFSDPLYFSRIFKKHCGSSPEMFRGTVKRDAFRNIPGGVHKQSGCE